MAEARGKSHIGLLELLLCILQPLSQASDRLLVISALECAPRIRLARRQVRGLRARVLPTTLNPNPGSSSP